MKTSYQAPKLITHGTVSEITAASLNSGKEDFIFGTVLGTQPGNGGSFDACVTPDRQSCVNQAASQGRTNRLR